MIPRFKVGDAVLHRRSGKIFKVVDCVHNKPTATVAIKTRTDGSIDVSPTTISEHFSYKLNDGRYWRFTEEILESAIPCPNCGIVGWDWVSGCGECSFSPEDSK
jgi:hypothetical protein